MRRIISLVGLLLAAAPFTSAAQLPPGRQLVPSSTQRAASYSTNPLIFAQPDRSRSSVVCRRQASASRCVLKYGDVIFWRDPSGLKPSVTSAVQRFFALWK